MIENAIDVFHRRKDSECKEGIIVEMENRIVAKNPTAYHNYNIIDDFEAGIVLYGTEIKSIRNGKVSLKDSYAIVEKNREIFVYSMNISPYEQGNIYNKDPLRPKKLLLPLRPKKLLLNRREINKIIGLVSQKGYSLIPISIYFKRNILKMKLGVGIGKKLYDKREDLKKKEADKKIARYMKNN